MTELATIVGAAHVRPGTALDAVDGVVPPLVARPGTGAEVARLIAAAGTATVMATGLRGHLEIGARPQPVDLLMQLDRLDRVGAHSAADMTVVVEAGCPLPTLQRTLASAGQWLPIDPPCPGRTTVGGLVAANLWGPLRASQGSVRDLLIGLQVAGADGALVSGGGRVVKNVAGYDLPKLHVGAFGQLGVLTELVFRVRPKPPVEAALSVPCQTPAAGVALALAIRERVEPLWLAVASAGTCGPTAVVLVGFAGVPAEVMEATGRVTALASAARAVDAPSALREEIADFPVHSGAATLRVSVLPTDLGTVLSTLDMPVLAHVATGVAYVAIQAAEDVPRTLATLRALATHLGGTTVVERAGPPTKQVLDVWGDLGPALPLMRRVKTQLDPGHRLAPGRLL